MYLSSRVLFCYLYVRPKIFHITYYLLVISVKFLVLIDYWNICFVFIIREFVPLFLDNRRLCRLQICISSASVLLYLDLVIFFLHLITLILRCHRDSGWRQLGVETVCWVIQICIHIQSADFITKEISNWNNHTHSVRYIRYPCTYLLRSLWLILDQI